MLLAEVLEMESNLNWEANMKPLRGNHPFFFSNLKSGEGVDQIINFIIDKGGLTKAAA